MTAWIDRHGPTRAPARVALLVLLVGAPIVVVIILVINGLANREQQEAFDTEAVAQAQSVLAVVPEDLDQTRADKLGRALHRPQEVEVVVVDAGGGVTRSSPLIDLTDVPSGLRTDDNAPTSARTTVAGEPFLVAGGRAGSNPTAVFLFFSERDLQHDQVRTTVLVASAAAGLLMLVVGLGWGRTHRHYRALTRRQSRERAYTAHWAHELRTPVGALVTAASLIDESGLGRFPDRIRQPVEVMQNEARRLRRIVEDLLELSRLETGQVEVQLEPVDVRQVVEETVASYGWDRVGLHVEGVTLAHADRQSVARVILNLVGNAVRHARDQVDVTIRGEGSGVVLEVTDDGPGIEPENEAVLTGADHPGVVEWSVARDAHGLGLLIARSHAGLVGATIEVDSDAGSGTTVRVRFPAAGPEIPDQPRARSGRVGGRVE